MNTYRLKSSGKQAGNGTSVKAQERGCIGGFYFECIRNPDLSQRFSPSFLNLSWLEVPLSSSVVQIKLKYAPLPVITKC